MKRILFIPHAPATPLRTRAGELARALARRGAQVDLYSLRLQPKGLDLPRRIAWQLGEVIGGVRETEISPGLREVAPPKLHRLHWPVHLVDRASARLLARRGYDAVINEGYGGILPVRARGTRQVYDLVDDHSAGWRHAGEERLARAAEAYVARAIGAADRVVASSHLLVELARARYGRDATLIPNGADVGAIRAASGERPRPAGPVVGYVGGMDGFVRIDFALRAVEKVRARGIPAELALVGDGPALRGLRLPEWARALGFRPPREIPALLTSFAVGICPFEISPYTDAALPLKLLEYGAARRPAVSTPLAEIRRHSLPWVTLAPLDEDAWAESLAQALTQAWSPSWDAIVDRYDWLAGADKLLEVLQG